MATKKKTAPRNTRSKGKSGIHIKPSKKGTFTAMATKAGKSVQAEASAVLADPKSSTIAKDKANFARNAKKWRKK